MFNFGDNGNSDEDSSGNSGSGNDTDEAFACLIYLLYSSSIQPWVCEHILGVRKIKK
jgi:hypothetical protein